jgi:hypothetical protein
VIKSIIEKLTITYTLINFPSKEVPLKKCPRQTGRILSKEMLEANLKSRRQTLSATSSALEIHSLCWPLILEIGSSQSPTSSRSTKSQISEKPSKEQYVFPAQNCSVLKL